MEALWMGNLAYSKADVGKELMRVFKVLNRPFSRREYNELGNIPSRTVERYYGSWTRAIEELGLAGKFKKFKDVEQEVKTFNPDAEVAASWKKEKEELVERAEERKNKWLRQHVLKIDVLREMLEETLSKADPPVVDVHPIRIERRRSNDGKKHVTLWFEFSDLQLGTLITSEEMGGINKHNWVIWKDKLQIWKDQVIEKVAEYKEQYVVDQVVVACLGDMVEGVDIFKGQAWQVDRHVVDQAIYGANDTAAAFIEIFMTHPDVQFHVLEVFGNHGRIGKKGENPYSCSMDKVFQRMTALQVTAAGVKNFKWHENEAWFFFVEIYGWHHLLLHGDQGMSGLWSSRPTINGLEKGVVRYNQMMQQQIHFVHVGHFHSEAQMAFNMSQILINSSFVGTSTFSARQMVASSPPLQVMHVFEPDVGLSKTERLYLTKVVRAPIEPHRL
jgi:hypothetical protein